MEKEKAGSENERKKGRRNWEEERPRKGTRSRGRKERKGEKDVIEPFTFSILLL